MGMRSENDQWELLDRMVNLPLPIKEIRVQNKVRRTIHALKRFIHTELNLLLLLDS